MDIDKELDLTRVAIFKDKLAAFFGSLMCNVPIKWDKSIPTACTNGASILWNPEWFKSLSKETRVTILMHELNHIGRMHLLRGENKDQRVFNIAADIRINNDLETAGYSFVGVEDCWKDRSFDINSEDGIKASEEEIYEKLLKDSNKQPQGGAFGQPGESGGDMQKPSDNDSGDGSGSSQAVNSKAKQDILNAVAYAVQAAKAMAGKVPGDIEATLGNFLKPKISWDMELRKYLTEVNERDYTWRRPNRRYQDIYLPSLQDEEGRLENLAYFLDVSGSVSNEQIQLFMGEVKYIWDVLKPKKLTLVQFDSKIQKEDVYKEGDPLSSINIIGRGGTDLVPVRKWILKHKPTCSVVFSDLECSPMGSIPKNLPLIYVKLGGFGHMPTQGKVIEMNDA